MARRANVRGQQLSELQKHLLLKRKGREARLSYFERARRYPGFVQALGEAIDELKVHMVWWRSCCVRRRSRGSSASPISATS